MKAPASWYDGRTASAPLMTASLLFVFAGYLRRTFAKPYKAKVPVICIGNIVAGGSGKTPTAITVAEALKSSGKTPVFVTRGYGGKLAGPVRVNTAKHSADDVGDEALLLARAAPTWVGRDRVAAIKLAEQNGTHIILDDGLQNPNILPDISLLVIDGAVGLGNNHIIPAGPLRENLKDALKRVKAVVMVGDDETHVAARINVPILQANIDAVLPAGFPLSATFVAFAGIGRPEKFYATCHRAGLNLIGTRDFADHYKFTPDDLETLELEAIASSSRLLTTEKDWVRLPPTMQPTVETLPVKMIFTRPDALLDILK